VLILFFARESRSQIRILASLPLLPARPAVALRTDSPNSL
jgi:hypothetical protein